MLCLEKSSPHQSKLYRNIKISIKITVSNPKDTENFKRAVVEEYEK